MTAKLIFLSHIHEEKELAIAVKEALEDEFSGFVDVFVSSDGTSIPAGSNFLKRIEGGLTDCIAAIYLISPSSVKRPWVNFELGAVWVRNALSIRDGKAEIPALPLCHSGAAPGGLPAPLNNLNAITGNQASQLEFAFRSIQSAVGGKGRLKTDFDSLASKISALERQYTLGDSVVRLVSLITPDRRSFAQVIEQQPADQINLLMDCGFVETTTIDQLRALSTNELQGRIELTIDKPGTYFATTGAANGASVKVLVRTALLREFKHLL